MNIGFQNGQKVFAGVSESGWTIGFGSYTEDESDLPPVLDWATDYRKSSAFPKVPVQILKLRCSTLW